MLSFGAPLELFFRQSASFLTSPDRGLAIYVAFARNLSVKVLHDTWSVLNDPVALKYMGLQMNAESLGRGAARDLKLKEDRDLAEDMVGFCIELVKSRSLSIGMFVHCYPQQFALLCSEKQEDVQMGLQRCREVWMFLEKAEKDRHTCLALKRALDNVPWLSWLPVRDTFLCLAQVDFRIVPDQIKEMWLTLFEGWGQSGICENAINKVEDHARDSKNGDISLLQRWRVPYAEKLMDGRYDRAEVEPDSIWRDSKGVVKKEAFNIHQGPTSVPNQLLEQIKGRAFWKSYSPQSATIIPACWNAVWQAYQ